MTFCSPCTKLWKVEAGLDRSAWWVIRTSQPQPPSDTERMHYVCMSAMDDGCTWARGKVTTATNSWAIKSHWTKVTFVRAQQRGDAENREIRVKQKRRRRRVWTQTQGWKKSRVIVKGKEGKMRMWKEAPVNQTIHVETAVRDRTPSREMCVKCCSHNLSLPTHPVSVKIYIAVSIRYDWSVSKLQKERIIQAVLCLGAWEWYDNMSMLYVIITRAWMRVETSKSEAMLF